MAAETEAPDYVLENESPDQTTKAKNFTSLLEITSSKLVGASEK